ncbi:MAG: diacylglycerol kinase family lipid kinase [Pyrinomonadaceae bacterium]|nr:diacylglycerol kinase family lipid kinase [Pyrinomonadaceae bacterium]
MNTRKAILISNPKTGRYASRRLPAIEDIYSQLNSADLEVELVSTTGPGDATRIAADAGRKGVSDVIVAGGDGTINEALQGLVGTSARLGILPRGTANVLAGELGLPLDCRRAAGVIARGKTRRVHVGCALDETDSAKRYFLLMAGIGLDATVVGRVHPGLKKRFGKGAFWFSGLSYLADWKPKPFEIEVEGQTFTATFATIGKAASYGGDLTVTPRAQLDQPDFEICIIETHSRLRYLYLLSHAMRSGMPGGRRGVHFLRATRARATGEAAVQVDGELIGNLPMTFEIAPESIEVIVP